MADLVEVVYAIIRERGMPLEEFKGMRLAKVAERGAFAERLFLVGMKE